MSASRFRVRTAAGLAVLCLTPWLAAQSGAPARSGSSDRVMRTPAAASTQLFPAYVPLTQKERLKTYFSHMFSAESVLRAAAGAGIEQGRNTPSEWHQGMEGYGRRFASGYGEHIVQSTAVYGLGAMLHEDNRYFQSGERGAGNRIRYAIASSFMARREDGSRRFSISRITSYAIAAAVSRSWQPRSNRTPQDAAEALGVALMTETGFNVAREFLPRLLRARPPVEPASH